MVLLFILLIFIVGCTQQFDARKETKELVTEAPTSNDNQASNRYTSEPSLDDAMQRRLADAFEEIECPPPRLHNVSFYQGPLYDMHFHMPILPDYGADEKPQPVDKRQPYLAIDLTVDDLVCLYQYEGTDRVLAFFPIFPPVYKHHVELAYLAHERYPYIFIPSISPPNYENATVDAEFLQRMLDVHPGLFQGFGEIGLHPTASFPEGMPPDAEILQEIYPLLKEYNLRPYFHLYNGQGEAYERVLSDNPDITFIFHGDNLVRYGPDNTEDYSHIWNILANHSNVMYGVDELYGDIGLREGWTKQTLLEYLKDRQEIMAKDWAMWKPFIERFPDQVMWGTDRGGDYLWPLDPEVGWAYNDYAREFIAGLDPSVQEKFAYKNAERIFKKLPVKD